MTDHFTYFAYGERLRSTIPLPELRPAPPGEVRWDFTVVDSLPAPNGLELLGEEHIYGDVSARFSRHEDGHRIQIDDTGEFELASNGREISWQPTDDPWWDFGRGHLIGRVLAAVLHLEGILTLHASGVQLADGVVGFLAPKHAGKSTLGLSLFKAGAKFVTDDSLPVVVGDVIDVRPGIHTLRVRPDDPEAEQLVGRPIVESPGRDGKVFLPPLPTRRVLNGQAPLAALYLLTPTDPEAERAATRELLPPVPAAIYLLGQAKIGAMLGSSFAPELLDQASKITSSVSVYRLLVARDLRRMNDVVETILGWHGGPEAGAAPLGGLWSE